MAKAKPRANDDGVLFLVKLRRKNAVAAFRQVVEGFTSFPAKVPSMTLLLDYMSNMLSSLELMLKLLTGNWTSHDVQGMYTTVFNSSHPNPDFHENHRRSDQVAEVSD